MQLGSLCNAGEILGPELSPSASVSLGSISTRPAGDGHVGQLRSLGGQATRQAADLIHDVRRIEAVRFNQHNGTLRHTEAQ